MHYAFNFIFNKLLPHKTNNNITLFYSKKFHVKHPFFDKNKIYKEKQIILAIITNKKRNNYIALDTNYIIKLII